MILGLCVLVRVFANPLSNVFQKVLTHRGAEPLFIIGGTHGLLTLACLPFVPFCPAPRATDFWLEMTVCAFLAVASNALLVQALRLSDLSILGPINAYKSVVSLLPGIVLLGEVPRPAGLAGIALIVGGSYFLTPVHSGATRSNPFSRLLRDRGVRYRLAALVLSATEAVFLKRALLTAAPTTAFVGWAILGFAISVLALALMLPGPTLTQQAHSLARNRTPYVLLAITTALMQFCTLVVLDGFLVGYALALFQTSTVVSVLLGHRVFREPHLLERLTGSLVMAAGAALIVLSG